MRADNMRRHYNKEHHGVKYSLMIEVDDVDAKSQIPIKIPMLLDDVSRKTEILYEKDGNDNLQLQGMIEPYGQPRNPPP